MQKLLSGSCFKLLILSLLCVPTCAASDPGAKSSKILVYGATGKVGSQVVNEALNRGHYVTAISRDPSKISVSHKHLSTAQGNVLDPENVAGLVAGQDVVIVSVRGVVGKSKDPKDAVVFRAVENLVLALRNIDEAAPRLIHVGGSGSLEVKPGVLYADTLPMIFIPRKLQTEIEAQVLVLEYLREVTDVDWTYATPPKNFTNGKRTGIYRIGGDQLLESPNGRSRISRADFAVALIDEVENPKHIKQRFAVAY